MSSARSKYVLAFGMSWVFVLLLLLIYFVHVRYFRVDVVFYSALFDVALASVAGAVALFWPRRFQALNGFEKAQLLVCWALLGYIYAISVPTVIDRSLSFYMLEKLQQRGGGIRLDRFEAVFTQEYAREHHLVDVRLTEQQASGTLRVQGGCVRLTERGQRLADFSRLFRKYFLPRHRLLMGNYSDVLTDPFAGRAHGSSDSCR